jgi:cell division protein FtsL
MRAVSVLLVIIVLVIVALAAIYIYNPNLIYNLHAERIRIQLHIERHKQLPSPAQCDLHRIYQ